MGAMITILYDVDQVDPQSVRRLAGAVQKIVLEAMGAQDVFAYIVKPEAVVAADPIELFIQVNKNKVANPDGLMEVVALEVTEWKTQNNFEYQVNLNVIPVEWLAKFAI